MCVCVFVYLFISLNLNAILQILQCFWICFWIYIHAVLKFSGFHGVTLMRPSLGMKIVSWFTSKPFPFESCLMNTLWIVQFKRRFVHRSDLTGLLSDLPTSQTSEYVPLAVRNRTLKWVSVCLQVHTGLRSRRPVDGSQMSSGCVNVWSLDSDSLQLRG